MLDFHIVIPASSYAKRCKMCGRYSLSLRTARIRQQLEDLQMDVDEAPDDEDYRQSYNFAPGNNGIVYRANVPDHGSGESEREPPEDGPADQREEVESRAEEVTQTGDHTKYKLQAMKWGLVPFWTKRNPDYSTLMKTINCRDDSLLENKGMWTTMKQRKRCIVIAEGFFEWLKKNDGKDRIPHFIKRKDGQLMMFAGLWDCVKYQDSDEKLYSYTIITTDANPQVRFLHCRMPVILEAGSDEMWTWLDPNRSQWSDTLQGVLKPFSGDLEIYQVSKDVNKVGNNSPTFIVPFDSPANKKNIAHFFGNTKKPSASQDKLPQKDPDEPRKTTLAIETTEDNAPLPVPKKEDPVSLKREHDQSDDRTPAEDEGPIKALKSDEQLSVKDSPPAKKTRNAVSNAGATAKKLTGSSPKKSPQAGNQRITAFFGK